MNRVYLCLAALLGATACNDFYADRNGTVYECPSPGYQTWEFCSDLNADELGAALQRTCHRTTALLPALQGCDYGCDGESGCEARHGCFCPPEGSS